MPRRPEAQRGSGRAAVGPRRFVGWVLLGWFGLGVCSCRSSEPKPSAESVEQSAAPPWAPQRAAPAPPRGMVWIPEGVLIAGTPPGRVPRIADEEMPGEQVVLGGFFIDVFAYPNEEGAIPQTGMTQEQAQRTCAEQGKRLCTELEWERACKGPRNLTYEYGERYQPEACLTGRAPRMLPSGHRPACQSEFGVRDLHGGIWEWTSSRFGRGRRGNAIAVRGGNSPAGDVVGRCANASARSANTTAPDLGFRCCKGERNAAEVALRIERGSPLQYKGEMSAELSRKLQERLPADVREALAGYGTFRFTATWAWRPIGNVELLVGGGCAGVSPSRHCGVVVAERAAPEPELLGWIWAGHFPPVVRVSKHDSRRLWVHAGDRRSYYRQAVTFEWGRVRVGEIVRNLENSSE